MMGEKKTRKDHWGGDPGYQPHPQAKIDYVKICDTTTMKDWSAFRAEKSSPSP